MRNGGSKRSTIQPSQIATLNHAKSINPFTVFFSFPRVLDAFDTGFVLSAFRWFDSCVYFLIRVQGLSCGTGLSNSAGVISKIHYGSRGTVLTDISSGNYSATILNNRSINSLFRLMLRQYPEGSSFGARIIFAP